MNHRDSPYDSKAYDKWVQKNNGKIFKYEIDKDNPND